MRTVVVGASRALGRSITIGFARRGGRAPAAFLIGPDDAFITGSDLLIGGGVTASFFYYGELAPQ
jgi:hypothetical protein